MNESEAKDILNKIHSENVGDIFDGFALLAKAVQKMGAEKSAARKERRKKKARDRYAFNKQIGKMPKPKVEEGVIGFNESYYEPAESCFCATVRMPPCSWCESGGYKE